MVPQDDPKKETPTPQDARYMWVIYESRAFLLTSSKRASEMLPASSSSFFERVRWKNEGIILNFLPGEDGDDLDVADERVGTRE